MEDEKYLKAKKKVRELKSFYSHLAIFFIINLFLLAINIITTPEHLWFYWVTIGWGIGLIFNAYSVFASERMFGSNWEKKKINEFMDENDSLDEKP